MDETTFSDLPLKGRDRSEYDAPAMEIEATRLMAAVKRGDDEAFDRLVRSLRARAHAVAQSLVGSREDAMDLAQEAFLKTYRARGTFRDGEPFLPWFHRILRNTCFSFLRKHRRLRKVSLTAPDDDEADWEVLGSADPPSLPAERDETRAIFWRAFETLSSRDREILGLRHFQDASYREIATVLEIPEGTVMSRLFHARRRLREALAPELAEPSSEAPSRASATGGDRR